MSMHSRKFLRIEGDLATLVTEVTEREVALVRGVPRDQLHDPTRPALARIVSVEASEYAERRGLAIALPAALEMTSLWWATLDSNQ